MIIPLKMISFKFRYNPKLNISLYFIITDNYRYVMRLHVIVYFEFLCITCTSSLSSLSSLLTVQSRCHRSNNHVRSTMINNEIARNSVIDNVECDINHTNSLTDSKTKPPWTKPSGQNPRRTKPPRQNPPYKIP